MSATEADPGPEPEHGLETSEAHEYFKAVEETFIALRGAPLLLSQSDYRVAEAWYGEGIPLTVIAEALRGLFEKRKARGKDARGMVTLRYCQRAVAKAWKHHRELTASGRRAEAAPPLDVPARLAALALALPAELPDRAGWAGRIEELAGSSEEVEEALAELDEELIEALETAQDEAARRELEGALARALARIADRLPAAELDASRKGLARQLLRGRWGLPVLSLFAPEIEE